MCHCPAGIRGFLLVAMLLGLAACASREDFQDLKEVSAGYLNTLLVEEDFQAWSEFYQPGAQLNGTQLAATVMKGYARGLHHAFPDMTIRVVEQIGAPDRVVTHFVIHGTHKRAFSAMPASNRPVDLEGVAIDHFQDGLIVRTRLMLDVSRLTSILAGSGPISN